MIRPRFYHLLLCFISLIFINLAKAQYISVDKSLSAQDLVNKFIGPQNTSCIAVSNVSVSGQDFGGTDLSYGYFYKNGSAFDIDEGIILSTGKISLAPGPNDNLQSEYITGWDGDSDLFEALASAGLPTDNLLNATYLEFDFESLQSDQISFDYMFLSEEYRKSNCQYSDAFAFLIKKADNSERYRNIALVPGTDIPVTSLSINDADGCKRNVNYFGKYNEIASDSPTNFNGQTRILKAVTTVEKGVKYHIKLVIADHGDSRGLYDSAVFLKSGSFTGNIDLGPDLTLENADPLCTGDFHDITTVSGATSYRWFRNGVAIPGSDDLQTYRATQEGEYRVDIVLSSGCRLEGNLKIEAAPVAQIDTSAILICDNDLDGNYTYQLSTFDRQIVRNYEPGVFNVLYYTNPAGTGTPITDFTFTTSPQTLYIKANAFSCDSRLPKAVQFYYGSKLSFNTVETVDICDNDISGNQTFNLADYIPIITAETGVTPSFFGKEQEAMAGGNSTVSNSQTIDADQSIFIRIEKDLFCPNYKEIRFLFKQPKASALLKDTTICRNARIDLDAGPGFTSYKWNTGATTRTIENVPAGDYSVILGFNDCFYEQFVKITEAEEPVIDNVLIEGTTVTVLVSGGTLPYQYALDGGNYQSSNIFNNVELGAHTVYVKGADGCAVIAKDFTLINSQNYITPNNDGVNDVINYSSLLQKLEPKFEIYDRFGVQVFKGDTNNQYIWNGTASGRVLPTSSYWYILEWNEAGNPERTKLSGWILLKNRN